MNARNEFGNVYEEILLEVTIEPFLQWFKEAVLKLQPTSMNQQVIRGVDAGTGLLASAIVAPLGYEFGMLLANAADISDPNLQRAIAYYFSITATGSAAVLVGRVSNSVLEKLITSTPETKKALRRQNLNFYDAVKVMMKTFLWCSAALSAVPESYLAYEYFHQPMGWWSLIFVAADMEALTVKNGWAIQNLSTGVYRGLKESISSRMNREELSDARKMRRVLHHKLQRSMMIISQLTEEEIDGLFEDLFQKNKDVCIDTNNYREDLLLHKMNTLCEPPVVRPLPTPKRKPAVKTLFGYVGSAIGAVGSYTFYPIARQASEHLMDAIGIEDSPERQTVADIVGVGSYLARSALAVYATGDSFEKFYDWFVSLPSKTREIVNRCKISSGYSTLEEQGLTPVSSRAYLHGGLSLMATLVSISGGAPRAAMTNDSVDADSEYGTLLIACAFIGAFATNFWAVHGLLQDTLKGDSKRAGLLGAVAKLIQMLPEMTDEHITALYEGIDVSIHSPGAEEVGAQGSVPSRV
ncbi:MAG: hypothetical protein NXI01_06120 [Gammaproteobacteria bacterium]|nr:hypothetical protein [Gammaproteobacteria bacterium]